MMEAAVIAAVLSELATFSLKDEQRVVPKASLYSQQALVRV